MAAAAWKAGSATQRKPLSAVAGLAKQKANRTARMGKLRQMEWAQGVKAAAMAQLTSAVMVIYSASAGQ
ncbi:MAG: hypothetical protein Q7T28_14025 [Cypionkella sp.]|nr:hypothetical protein [Cypionkella sp.]